MLLTTANTQTNSDFYVKSIYNGISDILIVLSERVEIQTINFAATQALQYSEDELNNQSIGLLIQKNDFDLVRDTIRNTYNKKELHEIGLNLVARDKSIIPSSCSFSPLYGENNTLTGILMVAKNLTTLINAQKQLQEKNDELNLFVYKASHDLKSPVSSVRGLMTLLKKSDNQSEIQTYHHLIDEGIPKLENVINDLMVLGQITYNELVYEEIDINSLIDDILRNVQFTEYYETIDFNITIENNAKGIICEKGLFTTVLYNLIDNAVKYRKNRSDQPSMVRIHVSRFMKGISLVIEDNGIGIDESHQPNIFKMFYRANNMLRGSGLGLYIVKMAVLKLGGNISFKSAHKKGTTFHVYIPTKELKEN